MRRMLTDCPRWRRLVLPVLLAALLGSPSAAEDDEPLGGPRIKGKVFAWGQGDTSDDDPPGTLAPWAFTPPCARAAGPCYAEELLPIRPHKVFDLGVADADQDGDLDVFTTGCAHPIAVLAGDGAGAFADMTTAWGLQHNRDFPGFEAAIDRTGAAPGLYVDNTARGLAIRAVGPSAGGEILWYGRPRVFANDGFDVTLEDEAVSEGLPRSRMAFSCAADAFMRAAFKLPGTPARFRLDARVPLDRVFVGSGDVHPMSHEFSLVLQDRHSMAWADYDGDGRTDVFLGKGGLGGRLAEQPGLLADELLAGTASGFEDRAREGAIVKGTCRGREAEWVDVDGDGRLDLYVGCSNAPPQLHRQLPDGCFLDVARQTGLLEKTRGRSAWMDADGDGDVDLLRSEARGISLYRNEGGMLTPTVLAEGRHAAKLALADVDGDGDLDVYAASPAGSTMLLGDGHGLTVADPTAWGLPATAFTAGWVDDGNDGSMDLHAVPGGLFRQETDGTFSAVDPGLASAAAEVLDARGCWADVDGDGARDLVAAVQNGRGQWHCSLHRSCGAAGHWLQMDLVGPPGNRPAIGARVLALGAFGVRLLQVGQSDGSHYSQGHYRLYLGLGRHGVVDRLRIVWPSGERQELSDVAANQLLTVVEPCADPGLPGCSRQRSR